MAPFSLKAVYSLNTLDTRFTTPSSVPYKAAADSRDGNGKRETIGKPDKRVQPSRWATPEFFFYYFVFLVTVPRMFWVAYDVSRCTCKPVYYSRWSWDSDI